MTEAATTAATLGDDPVLAEARQSGIGTSTLPGNTAKVRLVLDLARLLGATGERTLRILDVGAGGKFHAFNLWEPLLPFRERIELAGVDIAHLEPTAARAADLGFPIDLRRAGVDEIVGLFGEASFDVVVSTQVLEHLPRWADGLSSMARVLRPGGTLLVTCDAGELERSAPDRAKLEAKRAYARLVTRAPGLKRIGGPSGDWELAPTAPAVRQAAEAAGLEVGSLRHYGHGSLKAVVTRVDPEGRLLALALEERLPLDDPRPFRLLYLRATKR